MAEIKTNAPSLESSSWSDKTVTQVLSELVEWYKGRPLSVETLLNFDAALGMVSHYFGTPEMGFVVENDSLHVKQKGRPLIRTSKGSELDNTQEVELFHREIARAEEYGFFVRIWKRVDWLTKGTKEVLEKSGRKPDIVLRNVTGVHYMKREKIDGRTREIIVFNSDIHNVEFGMELSELDVVEIGVED